MSSKEKTPEPIYYNKSRYRYIKTVGKGEYGMVVLAESVQTGVHVAIKLYFPSADNAVGISPTTIREIALLKHLSQVKDNEHIACMIDQFVENSTDFAVVFPYYPSTLYDFLHDDKRELNLVQDKRKVVQLFHGLRCCHRQSVIHRDLKAANILLDEKGENLYLADFGLGKFNNQMRWALKTHHVATVQERPPELLLHYDKYDYGLDIWSGGVIAFQILTGKRPWALSNDCGDHSEQQEPDLLEAIVKALGFPHLEDLPVDADQLTIPSSLAQAWQAAVKDPFHNQPNKAKQFLYSKLKHSISNYDDCSLAVDFFSSIFQWNWRQRPTAAQLLKHKFLA